MAESNLNHVQIIDRLFDCTALAKGAASLIERVTDEAELSAHQTDALNSAQRILQELERHLRDRIHEIDVISLTTSAKD